MDLLAVSSAFAPPKALICSAATSLFCNSSSAFLIVSSRCFTEDLITSAAASALRILELSFILCIITLCSASDCDKILTPFSFMAFCISAKSSFSPSVNARFSSLALAIISIALCWYRSC